MANYHDSWKERRVRCSECGWHGVGDACERGEFFRELFELCCPRCGKVLEAVMFPTMKESKQNWEKLSEADKLVVNIVEERRADFLARSLKSASQLPDLEGNSFALSWDVEGSGLNSNTRISLGDYCIWREPSGWENFDRFIEIATILKQKYGSSLKDLVPTPASLDSLFGDNLAAPRLVAAARSKLAESD
jgi:hypothetical protein